MQKIIGKAVGPEGSVVAWHRPFFFAQERIKTSFENIKKRTANVTSISSPLETLSFEKGAFDLVLVHMSYHDEYWQSDEFGFPRIDPKIVTRALYEATKPGGVLGVVEHVANPGRDTRAEAEATHRILPKVVRDDFEAAGFRWEAESDVLRNPSDDRTKGVFEPGLRNRTDRIVYRFGKPNA